MKLNLIKFNKTMIKEVYKNSNLFLAKFILVSVLLCFNANAQDLDSLKVEAAENNLALKAQFSAFEAKLESVNQAKSWQDPNLSFGYFISPIETRVGPQIARFSLTQMLPWFGTYKVKGSIAAYQAEAAFEEFQNQKLKLFLNLAEQYYDLVAVRVIQQLEAEHLDVLKDLQVVIKSNYENNNAQLVDILRVDLDIEQQVNSIQILKQQDLAMVAQLNQLMNRDTRMPISIINPKQILEQYNVIKIDSISTAHPRLESVRNLQKSNSAESELARKRSLPQFGLGVDYAIIQDRNVTAVDAGQDAIMPMLSISLPIFGKKNRSRKQQVKLEGESLQFQLENEEKKLITQVQVMQHKQDELLKSVALHEKQMMILNDILRLSGTALANAEIQLEEILDLYEDHLLHHKMKIRTLANLQKTNETLNYLTLNSK